MEPREKDIQALCNAVLNMSTNFLDNPNGGYESTCPLCFEMVSLGGNPLKRSVHADMNEITHLPDCAYHIAKDLSTGFK